MKSVVNVYFLANDLVQLHTILNDADTWVYGLIIEELRGQSGIKLTDCNDSIITNSKGYEKLKELDFAKNHNLQIVEIRPEKVKVYIHIEEGVIQGVYSNNNNCQVLIGDIDDNADEPVILHDYDEPEISYPFSKLPLLQKQDYSEFRNKLTGKLIKQLKQISAVLLFLLFPLFSFAQAHPHYKSGLGEIKHVSGWNDTPAARCKAITQKGTQCTRAAANGQFCQQHDPQTVKCAGTTKAGKRCKLMPIPESNYCRMHQNQHP